MYINYNHSHVAAKTSKQKQLVPNSATRTPATDMLYNTANGRLAVQQIHHQRTKICHIPTS